MARRRSIWEQIRESTEGPTVTLELPREQAEQLVQILMAGLEMDGGMGMGDDEFDVDGGMDDIDADMGMGDVPDDGMDAPGFSAGDDDMPDFAAGDDDEGDDEPAPAKKKGPPGGKPAKKKGGNDKKKKSDDDSDDDKKDESADDDYGFRPQTALGESRLARLARVRSRRR